MAQRVLNRLFPIFLTVLLGLTSGVAGQESKSGAVSAKSGAEPAKLAVYRCVKLPPAEIARTVQRLFGELEGVRVIPVHSTQRLLIEAPKAVHPQIMSIVRQVDRAPESFRIRFVQLRSDKKLDAKMLGSDWSELSSRLKAWQENPKSNVRVDKQIQLVLADEQGSKLQLGRRTSVVTATMLGPGGQSISRRQWINIGTILAVKAMSDPQGQIVLELQFADSDTSSRTNSGDPTEITNVQHRQELKLKPGAVQLLKAERQPLDYVTLVISAETLSSEREHAAGKAAKKGKPSKK